MKKTTKRLLAAVLCLVMVLGALPLTALAQDYAYGATAPTTYAVDDTVVIKGEWKSTFLFIGYYEFNLPENIPANTEWVRVGAGYCQNPDHWDDDDDHEGDCDFGYYAQYKLVGTGSTDPGAVNANKTAAPVEGEDDVYEITLTVQGNKTTATTATASDVVLVVDNSSSMRSGTGSRLETAKSAANLFVDELLVEGKDNRIAVIGFGGDDGGTDEDELLVKQDLTSNKDTAKKAISDIQYKYNTGTNYTAALNKAYNYLNDRTDKKRAGYVIFMTDGGPGTNDGNGWNSTDWNGSAQVTSIKNDKNGYKIYTIGINMSETGGTNSHLAKLNAMSSGEGYHYNVTDTNMQTQLSAILTKIAYQIKDAAAGTNAVMTDVVNPAYFELVPGQTLPEGLTSEIVDGKEVLTWNIGEIPEEGATVTFKVKVKAGATDNLPVSGKEVPTNDDVNLKYNDPDGRPTEIKKKDIGDPQVTLYGTQKYTLIYENDLVESDASVTENDHPAGVVTLKGIGTTDGLINFSAPAAGDEHVQVVFIGWSTETQTKILGKGDEKPELVGKVDLGESNPSQTVHAVWGYDDNQTTKPDIYEVTATYVIDGGYWSGTDDTNKTENVALYKLDEDTSSATYGTWIEIDPANTLQYVPDTTGVVAKENHKTDGASWSASTPVNNTTTISEDTTFTYTLPDADKYNYSLIYNGNADDATNVPATQSENNTFATSHEFTVTDEAPSRTGYTFAGWYLNAAGTGTQYLGEAKIMLPLEGAYSVTLYAQWTPVDYTITYYDQDGTTKLNEVTGKHYGDTIDDYTPTVRENYTFDGWYTSTNFAAADKWTKPDTMPAGNIVVYAHWLENDKNVYTLTYNANAGGDTVNNMPTDGNAQTHDLSHTFTVDTTTTPVREGYEFLGWADSADASAPDYTSTSTNNTVTVTKESPSKVVYAVWERLLPELSVTKTVTSINGTAVTAGQNSYTAEVGDVIVWTITVTNSGNADGKFTLTDTLVDGNNNPVATLTVTPPTGVSADTEGYYTISAANGDTATTLTFTATYTVAETDNDKTLTNKVTLTEKGKDPKDPQPSTPISVDSDPDLSVSKALYSINGNNKSYGFDITDLAGPNMPTVKPDDELVWRIRVANSGNVAGSFTLTDTLGSTVLDIYTDATCKLKARFPATVNGDGYVYFYVPYTVTDEDIGSTLTNNVQLDKGELVPAPGVPVGGLTVEKDVTSVGGEFETEIEYPVNPLSDEPATSTAPKTAKVGDTITWTITVKNYFDTQQTFTLTDELTGNRDVTLTPAPDDGKYTIDAAGKNADGSIKPTVMTITATYEVQESDEGTTLVNNVKVTPEGGTSIEDDAPGVEVEGKLSVDKSVYSIKRGDKYIYGEDSGANAIPTAKVGDDIIWKIKVTNTDSANAYFKLEDIMGTTGLPIYGSELVGTELVPGSFDEDNKIIGTYMIFGEEDVTNIVSFFVKYTVKSSDLDSTLINTVTLTETDAEGNPQKNDDGSDKTHTDRAEPIKVEDKPNTPSYNPNYNAGVQLEKGEHFNYVIGYSDGTVRPEGNITRAEVATIFFRLLTDESRKTYLTEYNTFTDVEKSMWHNVAISTLARAGVLNGYNDGSFRPDNNITRAEMAAIISRFAELEGSTRISFTDIKGHWAEKSILLAASNGWINGYNDGSFRPDQNITRAETFAMINRVLERKVEHVNDLVSDMNTWVDNMDTTQWYYFDVQEATNYHSYERKYTNTKAEKWIKKLTDIDWTVYQY